MNPREKLFRSPLKLTADNLTPLSKTPWAGRTLREVYKKELRIKENIGESWELSFDPSMSSSLQSTKEKLYTLAPSLRTSFGMTGDQNFNLLVKLLSAGKNLSVQIHPDYGDKSLKEGECGKYESWLILEAEKDAGIYLGFKTGVTKDQVQNCLNEERDLSKLLNFIPVEKGDYFDIPPGTVHAIGAGVTLLEPQRVLYGKSGITYRFWDWNRKYDESGNESTAGTARELHIEKSLEVLQLENRGDSNSASLKQEARKLSQKADCERKVFRANPYYELHFIQIQKDSEEFNFKAPKTYTHLLVLEGECRIRGENFGELLLKLGESCLIPPSSFPLSFHSDKSASLSLINEKA